MQLTYFTEEGYNPFGGLYWIPPILQEVSQETSKKIDQQSNDEWEGREQTILEKYFQNFTMFSKGWTEIFTTPYV